ncbi:hypothetical protein P7C70_g893, partial [Phenoliferia sp. Uapishka_3]
MDVAGLSKLPKQTIINLCMGLGFLAHGYATGEFEVTDERLGVYLCTEHIDNPKGYAADQPNGDARKFDPRLRPPVDPRELEIDPETGMKNYIANERGGWDTSSRLVRERINQCITAGRRARANGDEKDLYECYRLLGTLLHTLEDFSAHSNWVELSLRRLGFKDVFCHVGDQCVIQTPSGPAPPLVTGTFGGSDFIHSLLGEATDHISEASVSDLAKAMDGAKSRSAESGPADTLRDLLFSLPGGTGNELTSEMRGIEDIKSRAESGNSATMSPQELHAQIWQVLVFRDNVVKGIERTIERIPGLSSLVEKLTDSINRFIFTTLEPLLKPVMGQATTALQQGSAEVINNEDQFEVFNNPHASDPTHSFLSKDHFVLILNEPAGKIATIILSYTVKQIVNAWEHDNVDPNAVARDVLKAFHHPYFFDSSSPIQREMGEYLKSWIDSQPHEDKTYILNALTKQSVRANKNKRKGHASDQVGHGGHGEYNSILSPEKVSGFAQQHIPGASNVIGGFQQAQHTFSNAQHTLGMREMDKQYAAPGTYMPSAGAPPFDHGQRPPIPTSQSSFDGPAFDPSRPFMPTPFSQGEGEYSGQHQGGGYPGQHQGGGGGGYPGQQHHQQHPHHQQGPPPPLWGEGPPQDSYTANFNGQQSGYGQQNQGQQGGYGQQNQSGYNPGYGYQ